MAAPSLTFGRGPGADVPIAKDDDYASPVHRRIKEINGRFWVEGLGSTNGTFIMRPGAGAYDIRVTHALPLRPGDRVRIGRTILPWEAK